VRKPDGQLFIAMGRELLRDDARDRDGHVDTEDQHPLAGRIIGAPVPMLVPRDGPVPVLIVGEAPGPRGADKSAIPFWGDAAGRHLYTALAAIGAVTLPRTYDTVPWDGNALRRRAYKPTAHGVALTNALDRCPTDDGFHFRAPARRELQSPDNLRRLAADIERLLPRGLTGILTLGRVATTTVEFLLGTRPDLTLRTQSVVHPSAQGLLSMAPNRGKGSRMADLQAQWQARCQAAVVELGFVAPTFVAPDAATPNT
jgi:hypothetical protein